MFLFSPAYAKWPFSCVDVQWVLAGFDAYICEVVLGSLFRFPFLHSFAYMSVSF